MMLKKEKGLQNEISFCALGTINSIKIFDKSDIPHLNILKKCLEKVLRIDNIMSAFKPKSDVSRINSNAGRRLVKINLETLCVIKRSIDFCKMSDGAFDITIRPLVELWGIGKKSNFIPSNDVIQLMLPFINYNDIIIDEKNRKVGLKKIGQAIDLGSIAKGFAADEAKHILLLNNIESAIINFGGNIVLVGKKPDENSWCVGIQNPLDITGKYIGTITAVNKTVVTSGCNEQFFIKDGKTYHHLLCPKNGYPVQNGLLSVTVIAQSSMDADALSTALFISNSYKCKKCLLEYMDNMDIQAIFVTEDKHVYLTRKFEGCFKLTDNNYSLIKET
jgi:thiamine biosynthesis lipoprotein